MKSAFVEFADNETGLVDGKRDISYSEYFEAKAFLTEHDEPNPATFGPWVPVLPVLIQAGLDKIGSSDWLKGIILDGIVARVGAVLGFIPQMIILFILLAFLEGCDYMARIAFVMDRVFRKFGLSGKSFIPILVATGCGVPGIMATRTIENERHRRMTIMAITFIPCSAKLPFIALIAGSILRVCLDCNKCIFLRAFCDSYKWNYTQENPSVCRSSSTIRYGIAFLSLATC